VCGQDIDLLEEGFPVEITTQREPNDEFIILKRDKDEACAPPFYRDFQSDVRPAADVEMCGRGKAHSGALFDRGELA
jgi:hypothetical protein